MNSHPTLVRIFQSWQEPDRITQLPSGYQSFQVFHFEKMAGHLRAYWKNPDFLLKFEQPFFHEEILRDRQSTFQKFDAFREKTALTLKFEQLAFEDFLVLLGQRFTSASALDESAIPPAHDWLLEQSFTPYNSQISKAVRAFEKHSERNEEDFWGKLSGNPSEKEEAVREKLQHLLEYYTWWNVYFHYKHEWVYEVRLPSGQGIRWKKSNGEFIGLVEPFLKE